jgi:hypothetical protein
MPHLGRPPYIGGTDLVSAPILHSPAEVRPPLGVPGSLSQVVFPNRFPEGTPDIRSGDDLGRQPHTRIIPLISTYTQNIIHIHSKLKNAFTHAQHNIPALHNYKIISALRKNRNLQDVLVRARFSTYTGGAPSQHRGHFQQLAVIRNQLASTSSPIIQKLTIMDKNIIYAITCSECHIIYVGETKHTILNRLKQHLYTIHIGTLNTQIVKHFQTHPITSLFITGLEMKACWSDRQRKAAEHRWISKLRTVTPLGLNIRE